ncbi:MAG: outer membrane lipoprotein carrier protein LolA [Gammaproteobacteria bacterium]|nr:outer membrane lipoprotein carrier protein LolA [Gammaproteobacteria bacterium]
MPKRLGPLLLLCLLLPAISLSAEVFTLEGLMQGLAATEHPTRHFTESRHSELLAAPITLHGTLAFVDGRLIKDIRQPFNERFSVEGDRLLIEREDEAEPRQIRLSDYPPLFTFVTVFRASLEGDLKTLQRHYQTALGGDANQWQLELRPRDAEVAVYLKRVEIAGTQDGISRFTIEEQSGDSSILELGEAIP